MAFLTRQQLSLMGFAELGTNVLISDKASIYGVSRIKIGNNVRIDDFCVLSAGEGGIEIGSYIHIAVYSSLIGAGKITLADFCNISSKVAIYSSNDDYTGEFMTNPMVPKEFTNVTSADVTIGKHVIIGSGAVIIPGVSIADGVAIGSLSFVNSDCEAFSVYVGTPIRKVKKRSHNIVCLESSLIKSEYKC